MNLQFPRGPGYGLHVYLPNLPAAPDGVAGLFALGVA